MELKTLNRKPHPLPCPLHPLLRTTRSSIDPAISQGRRRDTSHLTLALLEGFIEDSLASRAAASEPPRRVNGSGVDARSSGGGALDVRPRDAGDTPPPRVLFCLVRSCGRGVGDGRDGRAAAYRGGDGGGGGGGGGGDDGLARENGCSGDDGGGGGSGGGDGGRHPGGDGEQEFEVRKREFFLHGINRLGVSLRKGVYSLVVRRLFF